MLELLRFLRGSVDFEVNGGYCERFIGCCGKSGVQLFKLRKQGKGLAGSTALQNEKLLREAALRAGVGLKILRRRGVPAVALRYHKRAGVFAGLAAMLLVPLLLSMFIWRIEIVGNSTVPAERLRQTLSELGVHPGAFRRAINARAVERGMVIANEEIRWAGVNLRGSRAVVEVRERDAETPRLDTTTPHNVVAGAGGYITRMDVYEGQPLVRNGDSVVEGDILVSGIMENGKQQSRTVHARAQIIAQVEQSLAITIPYQRPVFGYMGLEVRKTLLLGSWRLPLSGGAVPPAPFKLETAREPLRLWGITLPLSVERCNYLLLEQSTEHITPEQARAEAEKQLEQQEKATFVQDSILARELTGQELEDKFILFADYLRSINIAEEREILLSSQK